MYDDKIFGNNEDYVRSEIVKRCQNFHQRFDSCQALHQPQESLVDLQEMLQVVIAAEQQRSENRKGMDNRFKSNLRTQVSGQPSPGNHFPADASRKSNPFVQAQAQAGSTPSSRECYASTLGTTFSTFDSATSVQEQQGRHFLETMGFASLPRGDPR